MSPHTQTQRYQQAACGARLALAFLWGANKTMTLRARMYEWLAPALSVRVGRKILSSWIPWRDRLYRVLFCHAIIRAYFVWCPVCFSSGQDSVRRINIYRITASLMIQDVKWVASSRRLKSQGLGFGFFSFYFRFWSLMHWHTRLHPLFLQLWFLITFGTAVSRTWGLWGLSPNLWRGVQGHFF